MQCVASYFGGFCCCQARALGHRLSRCGAWALLLHCTWDLGSGIKPVSPALAGGFFATEPPGKLERVQSYTKPISTMNRGQRRMQAVSLLLSLGSEGSLNFSPFSLRSLCLHHHPPTMVLASSSCGSHGTSLWHAFLALFIEVETR